MCGFFGFVDFSGNIDALARDEILEGLQQIRYRGPDDSGLFQDRYCVIGFNRLSIIGLNSPSQPFSDQNSGVTIACNGEIYNYRELRAELQSLGYTFQTQTDSEVVLYGYIEWRDKLWPRLNGIFAAVVWDSRSRSLVLARDQLGVKPIHYMQSGSRVYFGSDYNSFFSQTYHPVRFNQSALLSYLSFRYVIGSQTFYSDIFDVSPGTFRLHTPDNAQDHVYWDFPTDVDEDDKGESFYLERLNTLLNQSVRRQMMSDVPLGAFISGGLDSSTLIYFMHKVNPDIRSYIAGFDIEGYNEFKYADMVAGHFDLSPTKIDITPDFYTDAFETVIRHRGEPPSIPHEAAFFEMSRRMKKDITVVLSGEGADELMAGYGRIFRSPQDYFRKRIFSRAAVSPMMHFMSRYSWFNENDKKELVNPDLLVDGYFDLQSVGYLSNIFQKFNDSQYFRAMYYVQGKVHLPNLLTRLDRMTMAHSIEARVPFLDVDLVEFLSRVPMHYKLRWNSQWDRIRGLFRHSNQISEVLDTPKYILKKLMTGRLPQTIIDRKKMGFPVPLDSWLNQPKFRNYAAEILLDSSSVIQDFFNIENVNAALSKNSIDSYYDYEGKRIWMLLQFELWHRQYFSK